MTRGDPQRILVLAIRALGDVVLTTPVYRTLRRAYPAAYLVALVEEPYEALLRGNPCPNRTGRWTGPPRAAPGSAGRSKWHWSGPSGGSGSMWCWTSSGVRGARSSRGRPGLPAGLARPPGATDGSRRSDWSSIRRGCIWSGRSSRWRGPAALP